MSFAFRSTVIQFDETACIRLDADIRTAGYAARILSCPCCLRGESHAGYGWR